jgi:hypothetical protein
MWVNPNEIPRKKYDLLLGLAEDMKRKRLSRVDTFSKSTHAAIIMTKDFKVISYGENNYRRMPESMSCHAEMAAILNIKQDVFKYHKTYYMFVVKLSPKIGCFGDSACCLRCRAMLRECNIKFGKVYYSIPNGIACSTLESLPIHVSERDRNETSYNKLKKLM